MNGPFKKELFHFTECSLESCNELCRHIALGRLKLHQNYGMMGCRHGTQDSSASYILPPWVQIPGTPSMLLSI